MERTMRRGAGVWMAWWAACLTVSTAAAQSVESGAELMPPPDVVDGDQSSYASDAEAPRLTVLTSDPASAGLLPMLRAQLPGWQVLTLDEPPTFVVVDRLRAQLGDRDALLWLETGDPVVHVVVSGSEGRALSSPIPLDAAGTDLSRVYALAAAGLLVELWERRRRMGAYEDSVARTWNRELAELERLRREDAQRIQDLSRSERALRSEIETREMHRRNRHRSPLPPGGWSFRFGWVHGFSPHHNFYRGSGNPAVNAWPTGGLRASFARRFGGFLQVGAAAATLHALDLWNGSLSAFVSVHSRTRFRVGGSAEVGLLVARETDYADDIESSWASVRIYIPLELGVVVNRRGGVFVKCGPLVIRAPTEWFVGYDLSVEWEFD